MTSEEILQIKSREQHQLQGEVIKPRADPKDYAKAVFEMVVSQILQGLGFDSANKSTLELFSNIMIQFILGLGKSSTFHANLSGRSQCNFFDILEGFNDLGLLGSSRSQFIKEIREFVNRVDEHPFAHPIPHFPVVVRNKNFALSFSQMGENSGCKHIPDWLPAFPDPHTYMRSPLGGQRKMDLRIDKGEQARQRRKAERSLLNLQQRLLCSGLNEDNRVMSKETEKKQFLVKDTFGPAINALKGGGNDAMDVDVQVPTKRRPVVHFKMKAGKKMLVEDLDIHLRSLGSERRGTFIRDDDKDDKKRRAEFILRQSAIEYPQEVSQM